MSNRTTLISYSEDVDVLAELQSIATQLSKSMNLTSIAVTINQSAEENEMLSKVVKDELSSVTFDSNRLLIQRAAFGDRVTATAELAGESAIIAVRPHVYRPPEARFTPLVKSQEYQDIPLRIVVENVARKVASATDLTKAERIVSVGRGLKRKDDLALIQKLADELSAAIGCSRPLAADLGWLPEETHIGLTGVQVKPKLYLAIGISGQLQHLAGIKDSELIVAINTDKSAPIFQNCDYGIIGDLYQVIPEFINAITQLKNKK